MYCTDRHWNLSVWTWKTLHWGASCNSHFMSRISGICACTVPTPCSDRVNCVVCSHTMQFSFTFLPFTTVLYISLWYWSGWLTFIIEMSGCAMMHTVLAIYSKAVRDWLGDDPVLSLRSTSRSLPNIVASFSQCIGRLRDSHDTIEHSFLQCVSVRPVCLYTGVFHMDYVCFVLPVRMDNLSCYYFFIDILWHNTVPANYFHSFIRVITNICEGVQCF